MEKKLKRVSKACDFCHKRARKCRSAVDASPGTRPCLTCIEHDVTCTWTRITAKRGVKPQSGRSFRRAGPRASEDRSWTYNERRHGSRDSIRTLLDTFFETVYPVYARLPALCQIIMC